MSNRIVTAQGGADAIIAARAAQDAKNAETGAKQQVVDNATVIANTEAAADLITNPTTGAKKLADDATTNANNAAQLVADNFAGFIDNTLDPADTTNAVTGQAVNKFDLYDYKSPYHISESGIYNSLLNATIQQAEIGHVYSIHRIYRNATTQKDRINVFRTRISDGLEVLCAGDNTEMGELSGIKQIELNGNSGYNEKFILTINYDNIADGASVGSITSRMVINPKRYTYYNLTQLNQKTIGLDTDGRYTAPETKPINANNQRVANVVADLNTPLDAVNSKRLVFTNVFGFQVENAQLDNGTKHISVINAEYGYVYFLRQVFFNHASFADSVRIHKVKLSDMSEVTVSAAASGKNYGITSNIITTTFNADAGYNEKFVITFDYTTISAGGVAGISTAKAVIHPHNYTYTHELDDRVSSLELPKGLNHETLYYKVDGDAISIYSKLNEKSDLLVRFNRAPHNATYTFDSVRKNANTSLLPSFGSYATEILTLPSDNIGPHYVKSAGWHSGVRHGFERSLCTSTAHGKTNDDISSVWTTGTHTFTLAEIIDANTLIFDPTSNILTDLGQFGSSGTLTHVSGATNTADIEWSGYIRNTKPSVKSSEAIVYADGYPIQSGDELKYAKQIDIIVVQEIYDITTTNIGNNYDGDVLFIETIQYRVTAGQIEVSQKARAVKEYLLEKFHGLQLIHRAWQTRVYFENSIDTDIQDKTISGSILSGGILTYPNVNRAIISSTDFSTNVAMILNSQFGYGLNREVQDSSSSVLKSGNNKMYFNLVQQEPADSILISIGDTYSWNGVYKFFEANDLTSASFAYVFKMQGKTYLDIDFHSAGTETIPLPTHSMKTATVVYNNGSLVIDSLFISPEGVTITATGYGNARIELK